MYRVKVSPKATGILMDYAKKCTFDNGEQCAYNLLMSFEKAVKSLELMPERGSNHLKYIPNKYRMIPFWKHLWLVYQINKKEDIVLVDYILDERAHYGGLFDLNENE